MNKLNENKTRSGTTMFFVYFHNRKFPRGTIQDEDEERFLIEYITKSLWSACRLRVATGGSARRKFVRQEQARCDDRPFPVCFHL